MSKGVRICQICGIWFWLAFIFFMVVLYRGKNPHFPSPSELFPNMLAQTIHQRMALSEQSWKASVDMRHKTRGQGLHPQRPLFPAQTPDDFMKYPYTVWDFFPATYTCPHDIQRVGRLGDGGKWVCGMSIYEARPIPESSTSTPEKSHSPANRFTTPARDTIIYSFGVNDESTFETEMLTRIPSGRIFAFDYSVSSFGPQLPSHFLSRAHFAQVGLGSKNEPNKKPPFYSLSGIMSQYNHDYVDILKIDVEGAEYDALDAFMTDCERRGGVMPVGQLLIELHLYHDDEVGFERFWGWWERLEALGMRPTWLEVNLLAVTLGQARTEPRCVEYVFVNTLDRKSLILGDGTW